MFFLLFLSFSDYTRFISKSLLFEMQISITLKEREEGKGIE